MASAFKLSLRYLDYAQLLLYACGVSTLVLGSIVLVQKKVGLVFAGGRRAWLRSLALGLLNPLVYYLVLFSAYERLPAQEAQPLNYTWALTLTLLSIPLLKQRPSWSD
ncbi:MAG: drug/metabolite transporter (DMT)-like permease, partial [Candidatus Latescibacterota bacterium]